MIVADTNLIVYYLINGPFTDDAKRVFDRDCDWIAPTIWSVELLNVLATSVRQGMLDQHKAEEIFIHAPAFIRDAEVPPLEVLDLSVRTRFATFDCYYVVLARKLNLNLVTADKKILQEFPDIALSLTKFANGK